MDGYYAVMQFCPLPKRLEFVNVGVLAATPDGDRRVVLIEDLSSTARRFWSSRTDPVYEHQQLVGVAARLLDRTELPDISAIQQFIDAQTGTIQLKGLHACRIDGLQDQADKLFAELVAHTGAYRPCVQDLWDELGAWSDATFGPPEQRGPIGPARHLQHEVQELLDALEAADQAGMKLEGVDCLLLVFDTMRRAGVSFEELQQTAWAKLATNKQRRWEQPVAGQPARHIEEPGANQ